MRTMKVICRAGRLPVVEIYEDGCAGVTVVCDAVGVRHVSMSEIPVVTMQVAGEVEIDADAMVEIARSGDSDSVAETIDGFLAGLDPDEVDRLAMTTSTMTERPVAGIFRVLRSIAAGNVPQT